MKGCRMHYRTLGKTGLKVSEIGFGAEWLGPHSDEECMTLFRMCEDAGINIVDCWMPDPGIRSKIGRGIREHRDKWIVQGHFGSLWINEQYERARDLGRVKIAFQDLLTRLQSDYIDLGMIHYVDDEKEFEYILTSDYLKYIQDQKAAGVIRHIGMSTHNPAIGKLAVQHGLVEMILFSINPAFDLLPPGEASVDKVTEDMVFGGCKIDPVRQEFYQLCQQENVGLTVMKGYAGGRLFDAQRSPFGVPLTPVQCIHYALTRPAVASVLTGFETPEQLRQALAYCDATEEEKDFVPALEKASHNSYVGQCTYCGHCLPCPKRIDIATVNKFYDLAVMYDELPDSLREHYRNLPVHADACIQCHACESRCPFGVKIADRMIKANELFQQ